MRGGYEYVLRNSRKWLRGKEKRERRGVIVPLCAGDSPFLLINGR